MARPRNIVPTYRRHSSGRAAVSVYNADGTRTEILLPGAYGSHESKEEYERILAQLRTNGGKLPSSTPASDLTIAELVQRFMDDHVTSYYVDPITREATTEQYAIAEAVRPMVRLFAALPASEFDSLKLESLQTAMATGSWMTPEEHDKKTANGKPAGQARTTINRHIDRLKRLYRWACAKKLVKAEQLTNIMAVPSLKQGRCAARETEIVKPVDGEIVDKTLPFMAAAPADMVRVMLLSGCRVGELCRLRGCDLDQSGPVWVYTPARHKNMHRGHVRSIAFGPRCQLILRKYLKDNPEALLFIPREQDGIRKEEMRAKRKSKVQPSQQDRSKASATRKPGEKYDARAVNHAIRRGCIKAGVPLWHTHQLRHSAALNILREFGPEAARSTLGHRTLNMTMHYAGIDTERAKEVASKVG